MQNSHVQNGKIPNTASDWSPEGKTQTVQVSLLEKPEVIFIEPFYGGSHKQLVDFLRKHVPNSHLVTLSAKKWHWRARCSSLILANAVPKVTTEKILFCSLVLPLAELLGMRPDLQSLKKIVYVHENQLVYPVQAIKERDVQYAYNQITSCMAANVVVFNSHYNKKSFLDNLRNIIKMMPDYRPKHIRAKIEPKCHVLYFPLELPSLASIHPPEFLKIAWPHRWEFDKDPDTFFRVLLQLKSTGCVFRLVLLGECFSEIPQCMVRAKDALRDEILHWGFVESKNEYFKLLQSCHVVVSTAKHEFYGVSMLEAAYCGCFPLVPNRLVYPEIYPSKCLYETEESLLKRLQEYCANPSLALKHRRELQLSFDRYSGENLVKKYLGMFSGSLIIR